MTITETLPTLATLAPDNQDDLAALVRDAFQSETPLYPVGGGTSLCFGIPA